jgi:signal transduction histidine kinase
MTEEQCLYVTTMQSSAESLLACLNDILDFSKVSKQLGHGSGQVVCCLSGFDAFRWICAEQSSTLHRISFRLCAQQRPNMCEQRPNLC